MSRFTSTPRFDATRASHEDVQARLRQLLGDQAPTWERHLEPPRPEPHPAIVAHERHRASDVSRAMREQAEKLAAGAIDARTVPAARAIARLHEMGNDDVPFTTFRDEPKKPPVSETREPPSPEHLRVEAVAAARSKVQDAWVAGAERGHEGVLGSRVPGVQAPGPGWGRRVRPDAADRHRHRVMAEPAVEVEPAVDVAPEVETLEPAGCPGCGEALAEGVVVRCAVCGRPSHDARSVDGRWCVTCFWSGE